MVAVPDRVALAAGVLSPAVVLAAFVGAGALSPAYGWPTDAFSTVGTTGTTVAGLFNAGLVLGGLLAVLFAVRLWHGLDRLTAALYAVVGVSLVGAGLVPAHPGAVIHGIAGAGLFLGVWLVPWAAARADWGADRPPAAATSLALGTIALVVWLPYDLGATWAQIGYGAAELVSFAAFAGWSGWTVVRLAPGTRDRRDEGEAATR